MGSRQFLASESEMKGLEWGRLYIAKKKYDKTLLNKNVTKLYGDPYVKKRSGILEIFYSIQRKIRNITNTCLR